jgi:hypothetical protein
MYALPAVPIMLRCILICRFRAYMKEALSDRERAATEHRSVILALAGFSFSGALALPAYGAAANRNVLLPTFFVVVSFLCYLAALNAQAYKHVRWHDQLTSGVADCALLSLVLAVLVMVALLQPPVVYSAAVIALSLLVWGVDLVIRLFCWSSYFLARERYEHANRKA